MKLLGEELRSRRIEAGLTHIDVYKKLRISLDFLREVEDGAWGKLPPMTYSVGFMKTYCALLGVSADPYLDALHARERQRRPLLSFRKTSDAAEQPAWVQDTLMWAAILTLVVLGWVTYTVVAHPVLEGVPGKVQAESLDAREAQPSDELF